MTLEQVLFIVIGVITLGAALMVVTRRDVYHAALFLILSSLGVAGLYVLLEAPFLGIVHLLVYAGGIAVLAVFTSTVTRDATSPNSHGVNHRWWMAALVALALGGLFGWTIRNHDWATSPAPVTAYSFVALGNALSSALSDVEAFALPVGVAAVLLLAALIGAVTVARKR